MIPDEAYFGAGLLPPGYGLRARTRRERRLFDKHERNSQRLLRRGETINPARLVTWEDWQLFIFNQAARDLGIAWGNDAWWSVRKECTRREHMAAWGRRHDYRSTRSPTKRN